MILLKCTGEEIWDSQTCRNEGVPESWIEELMDCFESGFDRDSNSIYVGERLVNQYDGVRDLDLAFKLADYLGIDAKQLTGHIAGRRAKVDAIKAELDEL